MSSKKWGGEHSLSLSSGRNVLFKIPGRTETKPEIEFGFLEVVILKISWDGLSCQQMNDCEEN